MITWVLSVKVVVALFALGTSIHLARWRRQSREDWTAYDKAHGLDGLTPTRASRRARRNAR